MMLRHCTYKFTCRLFDEEPSSSPSALRLPNLERVLVLIGTRLETLRPSWSMIVPIWCTSPRESRSARPSSHPENVTKDGCCELLMTTDRATPASSSLIPLSESGSPAASGPSLGKTDTRACAKACWCWAATWGRILRWLFHSTQWAMV